MKVKIYPDEMYPSYDVSIPTVDEMDGEDIREIPDDLYFDYQRTLNAFMKYHYKIVDYYNYGRATGV